MIEYEGKRKTAEADAAAMIAAARDEAIRLSAEANVALEALIVRRTRTVEAKIAQAESQAVAEVRARSADVAIEAARLLLAQQMGVKSDGLVNQAIADVGTRMN